MTRKEAGQIKAKLTRAGWHVTGEIYNRNSDDRDAEIIAISASPEPYADTENDFYSAEDVKRLLDKAKEKGK